MASRREDSPQDERLRAALHAALLRYEFPNPERRGCPGEDVLRRLALHPRSLGIRHGAFDHVLECSPCYIQVDALRRGRQVQRRRTAALALAAMMVVAVAGWLLWLRSPDARPTLATAAPLELDMQGRVVTRHEEPITDEARHPLRLAQGNWSVRLKLPVGSPPGEYEVRLEQQAGRPLLTATGSAMIEAGRTLLAVPLDTRSLRPGAYFLGLRQPPWEWTYCPVVIENPRP